MHHLANNKLDSHISRPELPLPEITCLDTGLRSLMKVALKSVTDL